MLLTQFVFQIVLTQKRIHQTESTTLALSRQKFPRTAVIVGEEDYATPVAMAQQLHEAICGSTLTIIPGGRHLTPIECPEQIAPQILALLQRVGSQQAATEA